MARARKIGGYKAVFGNLAAPGRRIHMFYSGANIYCHVGTSSSLEQIVMDRNGTFISHQDRTPNTFQGGPNVGWTLDAVFDTTSNVVELIAHAAPDLSTSASSLTSTPFLGDITGTLPLGQFSNPGPLSGTWTQPSIAGGIVAIQPYVFDFDAGGFIGWSAPNLPNYLGVTGGTSGAGQARASAQKIVAGAPLRGGGVNSPAALFWSLSEVITANFVGSPGFFAFNTVSPSSSILSTDCVIEYDGLYFWAGVDRFLVYNGTVVEIPNTRNQDWFFDNMNWDFASKCFAYKVPRYGEIWWCAPLFGNTEPSHAVIYNIRENAWYDTALPADLRGAGYFAQGFRFPVMAGAVKGTNGYRLWLHEKSTDQVDDLGKVTAVRAYYTTPYLSGTATEQPTNDGISIQQIEPDIIQTGDMTVTCTGTWNPKVPDFDDPAVPIQATPTTPQDAIAGMKTTRRLAALRFESNAIGGSFVTGKNIAQVEPAKDMRNTGGSV